MATLLSNISNNLSSHSRGRSHAHTRARKVRINPRPDICLAFILLSQHQPPSSKEKLVWMCQDVKTWSWVATYCNNLRLLEAVFFEVITLVWSNQHTYFENAMPCSKHMLKERHKSTPWHCYKRTQFLKKKITFKIPKKISLILNHRLPKKTLFLLPSIVLGYHKRHLSVIGSSLELMLMIS